MYILKPQFQKHVLILKRVLTNYCFTQNIETFRLNVHKFLNTFLISILYLTSYI